MTIPCWQPPTLPLTSIRTTIVIASRKTERQPIPFSEAVRGVHIGHLERDVYYAFNFDSPDGVKIIRGEIATRLLSLLSSGLGVPTISECISSADRALLKHGLVRDRSGSTPTADTNLRSERSFNVWLHVVNGCNFRCFYCYIPELKTSVDPAVINQHSITPRTSELVVRRLIEFAQANSYHRLHIKFAGGEPTLNLTTIRHFCLALLSRAGSIRISFGMISNGSFCSEDLLPLLREFDINLSLSVDGFRHSHDQVRFTVLNRQKVGSWDTLETNIEHLVAAGRSPYLLFTVTRLNSTSLIPFASWAHSRALGFRLSPVRLSRTSDGADIEVLTEQLSRLYQHLAIHMSTSLNFERDARFAEWNLKKKKASACGSCRNYIAVSEDGQFKACQMSTSGSISAIDHSIDNALSAFGRDPKTALISRPELRDGACTRCEYFHVCTGGCPQHTLSVYATVDHPSPWCGLFGALVPVYIYAKASHMWRQCSDLARAQLTHFSQEVANRG